MLRNLENIWSKILVNSEEFAMFAVPNIYNLGMLCLYISKNSQYSGVSLTHNSLRLWVFGDIWRGSASSFVQKIINQIFSCQMPNTTEKFEVKVQSVPTSQTKSQSKLEKEIISIQKKVSKLQEECRHERNEKYRLLCYINRYCSALFPYFDRSNWKSHATLTLLATQDLPTFGYNMIDPLKSWCWGSILFYPFKISRFS